LTVSSSLLTEADRAAYERDGVVCLHGVLGRRWIERLRTATDEVLATPTAFVLDSNPNRTSGRFTRDRFLSLANDEFRAFSTRSPIALIAAEAMRSSSLVLMSDLVFAKEPQTPEPTPWHHDLPYGWSQGRQLCQFWIPLDTVDLPSGTMEFVRGSHRWGKLFNVRSFAADAGYESTGNEPVPDIDADRAAYDIVHFDMEPGDCLLFSELTLHAAPGNGTQRRRRAISLHYAGDDARFLQCEASRLPFTDHGLRSGDRFESPYFPIVDLTAAAAHG
jgi:ectoine hydroxylase-related dioxygenase (phytanoyl-CoA dioxygenase family)